MTDLLIRPITIWQICGQIVDASFAIKGPARRLMVDTVSRLITMKVICDRSIATDPLATNMMSMTNGHWPSRHKDSKIHNLPQCQPAIGSMNIPNIRLFSICDIICVKEGKRQLSRKVEEIKDWERQSELSRDPATRRYLQTPNHRTSWTFPGCKAGNHKHFEF